MCYRFYSTVCLSSFSYASVRRDHSHSKASVFNGLKALLDRSLNKVDRLNNRYDVIGLPTISARNISARVILARMFHQGNFSAHVPFGPVKVPADGCFNQGMFRHGDLSVGAGLN